MLGGWLQSGPKPDTGDFDRGNHKEPTPPNQMMVPTQHSTPINKNKNARRSAPTSVMVVTVASMISLRKGRKRSTVKATSTSTEPVSYSIRPALMSESCSFITCGSIGRWVWFPGVD